MYAECEFLHTTSTINLQYNVNILYIQSFVSRCVSRFDHSFHSVASKGMHRRNYETNSISINELFQQAVVTMQANRQKQVNQAHLKRLLYKLLPVLKGLLQNCLMLTKKAIIQQMIKLLLTLLVLAHCANKLNKVHQLAYSSLLTKRI